jgi:hypothetical protein
MLCYLGGIIDPWIEKGPTIAVISIYVFLSCDAEATDYIQRSNIHRNCNIPKLVIWIVWLHSHQHLDPIAADKRMPTNS